MQELPEACHWNQKIDSEVKYGATRSKIETEISGIAEYRNVNERIISLI